MDARKSLVPEGREYQVFGEYSISYRRNLYRLFVIEIVDSKA